MRFTARPTGMPQPSGLAKLFSGNRADPVLQDTSREAELFSSGLPGVVVRIGAACDAPGGASALQLLPRGGTAAMQPGAPVSREDVARVIAGSLGLELTARNGGDGPGQLMTIEVSKGTGGWQDVEPLLRQLAN